MYDKGHREHGKFVKKKREEGNIKFMQEVEKAINEGREWEVVNRERRKWKWVNREIEMTEWTEYFKGLSGRIRSRIRGGGKEKGSRKKGKTNYEGRVG